MRCCAFNGDGDFNATEHRTYYSLLADAGYWTMVAGKDDLTKPSILGHNKRAGAARERDPETGDTPLLALARRHATHGVPCVDEYCRLLLRAGADPLARTRDARRCTALHFVAFGLAHAWRGVTTAPAPPPEGAAAAHSSRGRGAERWAGGDDGAELAAMLLDAADAGGAADADLDPPDAAGLGPIDYALAFLDLSLIHI